MPRFIVAPIFQKGEAAFFALKIWFRKPRNNLIYSKRQLLALFLYVGTQKKQVIVTEGSG